MSKEVSDDTTRAVSNTCNSQLFNTEQSLIILRRDFILKLSERVELAPEPGMKAEPPVLGKRNMTMKDVNHGSDALKSDKQGLE